MLAFGVQEQPETGSETEMDAPGDCISEPLDM